MHLNIDEFLIKHVLSKNPQYRDLWLSIAEWNVDSGWFICREDSGIYLVGSLSMDDPVPVLEYADAESACAVYIKRELEYLREG